MKEAIKSNVLYPTFKPVTKDSLLLIKEAVGEGGFRNPITTMLPKREQKNRGKIETNHLHNTALFHGK